MQQKIVVGGYAHGKTLRLHWRIRARRQALCARELARRAAIAEDGRASVRWMTVALCFEGAVERLEERLK